MGESQCQGMKARGQEGWSKTNTKEGHLWGSQGPPRPVNWELKEERGIRQPCLQRKEAAVTKCNDTCKELHQAFGSWQSFKKCGLLSVMGRGLF